MISFKAATKSGMTALANNGVYTAYLCSAGKYSKASMPGLKKARDESVNAREEWRRVSVKDILDEVYICQRN